MVVPKDWKEAHVTPIFKKGDRKLATNYRPVSLTSIVCKLLETLIKNHIMVHLRRNNLLDEHQHGFVPKKGCNTNLLESLENWLNHLENGKSVDVFYLDYAKAFDRVPHERLLSKIESYGVTQETQGWIRSFLSGRTQLVKLAGSSSGTKEILSGVPQGSVLGPLMFVLYVNDLPPVTENETQMFADDAKNSGAVDSDASEAKCQNDLTKMDKWTIKWQMDYNLGKCKHMRLGNRPQNFQYHLYNKDGTPHYLQTENTEKDLGITMDKDLTFDHHIDKIIKTANSVLGTIRRTFSNLNHATFTLLYKALVRSHLEYGQEIWSPMRKGSINKIEKVQRRATKLVKNIRNLPYEDRLKALKLPSLQHRRQRGDMITKFKITHGYLETALQIPYSMTRHLRGHIFKLEGSRFNTPALLHKPCGP